MKTWVQKVWHAAAWNDIPAEMVKPSFLKCGIKNNLDGSEDDLLMITLLLEKCSSLTQRQTSKDSMFSFLNVELII